MIEATTLAAFRAEYINSNELEEIYGIGRFRISQALIGSGALTNSVYPRIYRRGPALECLDKFRILASATKPRLSEVRA